MSAKLKSKPRKPVERKVADMPADVFMSRLVALKACYGGKEFVSGKSLRESWMAFERPDWMLWLLGRSTVSKKVIVTIAVEFAEMSVHNATAYPAVAECIAVAKRFLVGKATRNELSAAWSAARSAAWSAASAAESAAWSAARSAAWSAASAAESAARSAARSAASAASAASAESAESAAWSAAQKQQCSIIRKHVSVDEIVKLFT